MQNNRIYIHIADPCYLIKKNSPIDLEAKKRIETLYVTKGVTKLMFP